MKFFAKKETLTQTIAFMAIMTAVNVIITVLIGLFPIASLFLILLLPLTSTLVEYYCKDRYYLIYFFAVIGLSISTTLWNIEMTLFYVIPSLITGYVFGLFCKKNLPSIYSILIASLLLMGISLAFVPLINFLFNIDLVNNIETIFKLNESEYIKYIIPSIFFVISLIQISLSYLIISKELNKIGYEEKTKNLIEWINEWILFGVSALAFFLSFFEIQVAYILMFIAIYFCIHVIANCIQNKNYYTLIILGFGLVLNLIIFAAAYESMNKPAGFILLVFTPLWVGFITTIFSFLKRKPKSLE